MPSEEPETEAPAPEAGEENVFFVSQKALLVVKMKLKSGDEIQPELLQSFAYPGDHADEEMLVPVDLSVVDSDFPAEEEELIDINSRLDVDRMIEKLGAKKTAEAFVKAQQAFLENRTGEALDERPKPITVQQWKEIWGDLCEEGEEEAFLEDDDEVHLEGEEEEEEPAAKKAKLS
eukprot:TRINITY_DN34306_c0_g1_i1.p1 TRINITY_DN34306_c0_g1~~TRINITY_DN34306_c0_g1_i1.p1  ORF type:complete len:176 (-),score=70.41 TRINITY_DN34306_c0_g1_i1:114-641(-)